MTDDIATNGYIDGDVDANPSTATSLEMLAAERFSRCQTLFGGLGATSMALFGTTMLAACGGDDGDVDQGPIVDAGTVAATSAGRPVTLTATTSSDVITGAWTQKSGEPVTLTSTSPTSATFIAPAVGVSQDLVFSYDVTTHRGASVGASTTVRVNPAVLGFAAVPKNLADIVTVPAGYTVTVMTRLGDPLSISVSAYANNGTDDYFDRRIGDHGDPLALFGLAATGARDDSSSTRGLMVQNHENLTFVGAGAAAATLRRFMVGPVQCELTGIDSTPDGRMIFVGIQHPGEDVTPAAPSSNWPDSQGNANVSRAIRPRSAIVAITKDDGGVIAL